MYKLKMKNAIRAQANLKTKDMYVDLAQNTKLFKPNHTYSQKPRRPDTYP